MKKIVSISNISDGSKQMWHFVAVGVAHYSILRCVIRYKFVLLTCLLRISTFCYACWISDANKYKNFFFVSTWCMKYERNFTKINFTREKCEVMGVNRN